MKAEAKQYGLDIAAITKAEQKEIEDIIKESAEKQNKELAKTQQNTAEQHLKFIESISDATFDRIEANHKAMMQMLDLEIKQAERNIEMQQSLAERGLTNTLSFERKQLEELEKQRIEAERKQQQRQKREEAAKLVLAFLAAYQKNLETMPTFAALSSAFRDTLLAKVVGNAIAKFEQGGIVGMDGQPITDGVLKGNRHAQGGVLIEAEGGEGILSRKEIQNMGVANFYNLKRMLKTNVSDSITPTGSTGAILQGINEMTETLKSIPQIHLGIDNLGQIVKSEVKAGLKKITTYKRGIN